jgi:hypothetical protein
VVNFKDYQFVINILQSSLWPLDLYYMWTIYAINSRFLHQLFNDWAVLKENHFSTQVFKIWEVPNSVQGKNLKSNQPFNGNLKPNHPLYNAFKDKWQKNGHKQSGFLLAEIWELL